MIGRLVDSLLHKVARSGLRRGLAGEGVAWLALAGAVYLWRWARRTEESSTTIDLQPGDSYLVRLVERGQARTSGRRKGRTGAED